MARDKTVLPESLKPYFQVRDELSVQDRIGFREHRVIIPKSMRAETLRKMHESHIGINGCLLRSRECLYWPRMNSEVKSYICQCETCRSLDQKQQKESLKSHNVPSRPWAKVRVDLCSFYGKDLLATVDTTAILLRLSVFPIQHRYQ